MHKCCWHTNSGGDNVFIGLSIISEPLSRYDNYHGNYHDNLRPVMLISLLTSSPLLGINLNGARGMPSDNLPDSTILVHSSFITWEGGSAGAEISPPGVMNIKHIIM